MRAMSTDEVCLVHVEVEREARRLHVLHADRLACTRGCSSCCQDDLTVFPVEAEVISTRYAGLLAASVPHPAGACAFLDEQGACRVYDARPYVCRTQGLPLRWLEEDDEGPVELRDICPLNEAGAPLESLPDNACWTLGPAEERLATLQVHADADAPRVSLRSLFRR